MRESVKILRQAFKNIPAGPVKTQARSAAEGARGRVLLPHRGRPRGDELPYRLGRLAPALPPQIIGVGSFRNMRLLPLLLKGAHVADVPPTYWGLNYWPVSADR